MFRARDYWMWELTKNKNGPRRPRLSVPMLAASGTVTVLLLVSMLRGAVSCHDASGTDPCLFEFTAVFHAPMGRIYLDGFMACHGSRHRIAIYWVEPSILRDMTVFLEYSDFIFSQEAVHYRIHAASRPAVYRFSDNPDDSLLPEGGSVESGVQSALAILNRLRPRSGLTHAPLEVGKFFEQSRDQTEYSYEGSAKDVQSNDFSNATASDVQILNGLPYGRKYSKVLQGDSALVWSARRGLNEEPIVHVTFKPSANTPIHDVANMFDPNTLGRWTLIPDCYRAYWSFDALYRQLKDAPDQAGASCALADRLQSYLDHNVAPPRVSRALNRLWFKTALLTGETARISRSAQAAVSALCEDVSVGKYQALRELSSMAGQIWEHQPEQADALVRPLVEQVLKHVGADTPRCLYRLMPAIHANRWFAYGSLLLEEVGRQGLVQPRIVDGLRASLETARLARGTGLPPSDPCESSTSVKQYLAQLDASPPTGSLTMDDVRSILRQALARYRADGSTSTPEEVVRLIRMIVGEGPFCGDRGRLIESVDRFSQTYLLINRTKEPIDTVLATFLALSFCDLSTAQDHEALLTQVHALSAESQSQIKTLLAKRGLDTLVSPNDVESIFAKYEQQLQRYTGDPLYPSFKFPLTANEQARLKATLKQRLTQLEPLLEKVSHIVKYAGSSPQLKGQAIYGISSLAEQLIPATAFVRKPSYPGVSCTYAGRYGLVTVIEAPLYERDNRPKEKFKAMKYFHLGERLQWVVTREKELERAKRSESKDG